MVLGESLLRMSNSSNSNNSKKTRGSHASSPFLLRKLPPRTPSNTGGQPVELSSFTSSNTNSGGTAGAAQSLLSRQTLSSTSNTNTNDNKTAPPRTFSSTGIPPAELLCVDSQEKLTTQWSTPSLWDDVSTSSNTNASTTHKNLPQQQRGGGGARSVYSHSASSKTRGSATRISKSNNNTGNDNNSNNSDEMRITMRNAMKMTATCAILSLLAFWIGSLQGTRELRTELHNKLQASQLLQQHQQQLQQETLEYQRQHQVHHDTLQTTFHTLKSELQTKSHSLAQESERLAQREREIQQIQALAGSMNVASSIHAATTTTTAAAGDGSASWMGAGAGSNSLSRQDDLIKLVQTLGFEQYGLKPWQVELHVSWKHKKRHDGSSVTRDTTSPKEEEVTEENRFLTAEVSMLHMPVTVFTFLNQVSHELYHHVSLQVFSKRTDDDDDGGHEGKDEDEEDDLFVVTSLQELQWKERKALGLARVPVHERTSVGLLDHSVVTKQSKDDHNSHDHHDHFHPCMICLDQDQGLLVIATTLKQQMQSHLACFGKIIRGDYTLREIIHSQEPDNISDLELVSISQVPHHNYYYKHHDSLSSYHSEDEDEEDEEEEEEEDHDHDHDDYDDHDHDHHDHDHHDHVQE